MKRAMSGKLALLPAIKRLMDEIMEPVLSEEESTGALLEREKRVLTRIRKIFLLAAGTASQSFMTAFEEQQEVMADLADCITTVFALESAILRTGKLASRGAGSASIAADMTAAFADESLAIVEEAAKRVLAACGEGDALGIQLAVLRRLARVVPADVVGLHRKIARHFLAVGRYRL
jgi:hypothetical protein